jgi:hypothetical protein
MEVPSRSSKRLFRLGINSQQNSYDPYQDFLDINLQKLSTVLIDTNSFFVEASKIKYSLSTIRKKVKQIKPKIKRQK